MKDKRIYVERRDEGDYAVRRANSDRASDVLPTQRAAIERARELSPGFAPPCRARAQCLRRFAGQVAQGVIVEKLKLDTGSMWGVL